MSETTQPYQASLKPKAFLDYFRSRDAVPTGDDASDTTKPASRGEAEPPTIDLTEK
ncbi:hypothetical protein FRC01_009658, partial [Tulasnella sp. 417]